MATCNTLFILALTLAALPQSLGKAQTVCAPDCGPFGKCLPCRETDTCIGERCKCDSSHAGFDCSLQVEYCPDSVGVDESVTTCLNGGKCVAKEILPDESGFGPAIEVWRCDCRYATGDASAYAGTQCEFPSTTSCLAGNAPSNYAFCVNGGDCIREILKGDNHPGCTNCPAFGGRHCQYALDKVPPEELAAERQDIVEDSNGMKPGLIALLVVLGVSVLITLAFFVWRRVGNNAAQATVPSDLQLQERSKATPDDDDGELEDQDLGDNGDKKPQIV